MFCHKVLKESISMSGNAFHPLHSLLFRIPEGVMWDEESVLTTLCFHTATQNCFSRTSFHPIPSLHREGPLAGWCMLFLLPIVISLPEDWNPPFCVHLESLTGHWIEEPIACNLAWLQSWLAELRKFARGKTLPLLPPKKTESFTIDSLHQGPKRLQI